MTCDAEDEEDGLPRGRRRGVLHLLPRHGALARHEPDGAAMRPPATQIKLETGGGGEAPSCSQLPPADLREPHRSPSDARHQIKLETGGGGFV
ncbi:hypothetical protein BHE74_00013248 [Ensete ventricosum]|nr:hypothetical protein BHE74_00013248 [Ensete ventricosum]RZR91673.1 hypothetical protein BHM03_00019849 [Ensete ventricosum]